MTYESLRRARAYGYNPGPGIQYGSGGGNSGVDGFRAFSDAYFPTSANPEFNPANPNASDPYIGTNFISKWKAGKANKEFGKQKVVADFARNRAFEDYKKSLEIQSAQNFSDAQKEYEFKKKLETEALGEAGSVFGQTFGDLPDEQAANIIPPSRTFSSPQDQMKYVQAKFGAGSVNDMAFNADPRVQKARVGEAMLKGSAPISAGRGGRYFPAENKQVAFGGEVSDRVARVIKVKTDRIDYNPESPNYGKNIEEDRVVYDEIPRWQSPGTFGIPEKPTAMTQDIVNQTAPDATGEAPNLNPPGTGVSPIQPTMPVPFNGLAGFPVSSLFDNGKVNSFQPPQLEGAIPEIFKGAVNTAKAVGKPILDANNSIVQGLKELSPSRNQVKPVVEKFKEGGRGFGEGLNSLRQQLIRGKNETPQKSTVKDPLSLYISLLQQGIELPAEQLREVLDGIASYIRPGKEPGEPGNTAPLPMKKKKKDGRNFKLD